MFKSCETLIYRSTVFHGAHTSVFLMHSSLLPVSQANPAEIQRTHLQECFCSSIFPDTRARRNDRSAGTYIYTVHVRYIYKASVDCSVWGARGSADCLCKWQSARVRSSVVRFPMHTRIKISFSLSLSLCVQVVPLKTYYMRPFTLSQQLALCISRYRNLYFFFVLFLF